MLGGCKTYGSITSHEWKCSLPLCHIFIWRELMCIRSLSLSLIPAIYIFLLVVLPVSSCPGLFISPVAPVPWFLFQLCPIPRCPYCSFQYFKPVRVPPWWMLSPVSVVLVVLILPASEFHRQCHTSMWYCQFLYYDPLIAFSHQQCHSIGLL